MAFTHQKTVTVYPVDDSYAWSNGGASWVTITQQGATDVWDFAVSDNTTYSNRSATCTVTHSNGTTDESFTIDQAAAAATAPSVNMVDVTVSSNTVLIANGNVLSENGSSLTGRGFYFGLDSNMTNNTQYPVGSSIGTFSNNFTGLMPATTYYCWAYATNAVGTTYSTVTTQATSAASTYTVSTSLNDTAHGCAFVSSDVAQPAGMSPVSPMVSAAGLAGTVVTQEVWIQPEVGYVFNNPTGDITTAMSAVVPSNTVVTFANTLTANGNIKIVISTTIPTSNVTQDFNIDGTAPMTAGWLNFTTPVTNHNTTVDFTASAVASYTTFFFEYGGGATDPVVADFTLTADMPPSVISMGVINNTSNPKTGSVSLSYGANPNLINGYHDFYYNGDTSHASQNVRGHWIDITQTAGSPMNGIWASGGVDDPATDFASFTPGDMLANTYNRNPQFQGMAAPFEITMDPDVNLNASDRWWSTEPTGYVGGNLSGAKDVTNPWWVGDLVTDNSVTPHSAELDYSIGVDPVTTTTTSGGIGLNTEENTSPIGFNDFGGSAEITAGGPSPPAPSSNHPMTYCIVRHPNDHNNYISIRYDGDNAVSTTTTVAPVSYDLNIVNAVPTSAANGGTGSVQYTIFFNWASTDASPVPGPLLDHTDFSVQMPTGGTSSITSGSVTMGYGGNPLDGTYTIDFVVNSGNNSQTIQNLTTQFNPDQYAYNMNNTNNHVYTFEWMPCIVYGQPILMADGTTKLVEDILVGDEVKAISISGLGLEEGDYKTWSTSDFSSSDATTIITRATHGSYETYHLLSFSEGSDLKITHEHPVLSNRAGEYAFRRVDELLVNDEVFNAESGWVTLTSNTLISETAQTVSLGAETADNYFAQGILVHNDPNAK